MSKTQIKKPYVLIHMVNRADVGNRTQAFSLHRNDYTIKTTHRLDKNITALFTCCHYTTSAQYSIMWDWLELN
jgi:hypothetical protein